MTYSEALSPAVSKGFQATYELITAESCEQGDAADRGWLNWLGDAVDNAWDSQWDLQDLTRLTGYRWESDGSDVPRWLTCDADISDLCQRASRGGLSLITATASRSERQSPYTGRIGSLTQAGSEFAAFSDGVAVTDHPLTTDHPRCPA